MKARYTIGAILLSGVLILGYQFHQEYQRQEQLQQQAAVRKKVAEKSKLEREKRQREQERIHEEVKNRFYYQQLTEEEKEGYLDLFLALREFDIEKLESRSFSNIESEFRVTFAVAFDNPEFYWIPDQKYDVTFIPEDAKEVQAQLHAMADEVISQMPDGSEYDKVKYIYEYIILNTAYKTEALENDEIAWQNQSIRSVFLDKTSICNGYSLAFLFLCQKAGIEAIYIAGDTTTVDEDDVSHAWNLVKIDGQYYPVDTTWGDPTFSTALGEEEKSIDIDYAYLCMPKEMFEKNHFQYQSFFGLDWDSENPHNKDTPHVYPEIQASGLSYYQLNGGYFDTYNQDQIGQHLLDHLQTNQMVTIQIASQVEYDRFKAEVASDETTYIHDYLQVIPGYQGFSWIDDHFSQTISFELIK